MGSEGNHKPDQNPERIAVGIQASGLRRLLDAGVG
jgi:hypothetical protein